jgi:hypothetical protein
MAYKFVIQGVEVTCDTLEEVIAAVRGPALVPPTEINAVSAIEKLPLKEQQPAVKGTQGRGPKRAWDEAEEYARKNNLTKFEARAILKAKKTAVLAAAMKTLEGN